MLAEIKAECVHSPHEHTANVYTGTLYIYTNRKTHVRPVLLSTRQHGNVLQNYIIVNVKFKWIRKCRRPDSSLIGISQQLLWVCEMTRFNYGWDSFPFVAAISTRRGGISPYLFIGKNRIFLWSTQNTKGSMCYYLILLHWINFVVSDINCNKLSFIMYNNDSIIHQNRP